ncbi:MAG: hypothetical protein QOI51_1377 [Nocardioidaceae bacterium]|nr:hypothetical protein [Nocardioidaceae bacterium]
MQRTGTTEASWADWPVLRTLPAVTRPQGRVVVVSAHPDDEVLGAGGLIASLAGTRAVVSFVAVTDGEASHPPTPALPPEALAARRVDELVRALSTLGLAPPDLSRLGLPDSHVDKQVDVLTERIEEHIRGADLVLCPAEDGHSDHDAVSRATKAAAEGRIRVWEFPIWVWAWTRPGDLALPWERARRYELSASEQRVKRRALACFVTQVRPFPDAHGGTMLPPDVLEHFERPFEVFLT